MRENPAPDQIYRHFKGNTYRVQCIAKDSETGEACVVYQALYGDFGYYVRPLDMFMSEVDRGKYPDVSQKYRFERIDKAGGMAVPEAGISLQSAGVSLAVDSAAPYVTAEDEGPVQLDPAVEEFLNADSYDRRYEILTGMREMITDEMIDIMSTVVDIEVSDGPTAKRYDRFVDAIRMRRQYETSRLR